MRSRAETGSGEDELHMWPVITGRSCNAPEWWRYLEGDVWFDITGNLIIVCHICVGALRSTILEYHLILPVDDINAIKFICVPVRYLRG